MGYAWLRKRAWRVLFGAVWGVCRAHVRAVACDGGHTQWWIRTFVCRAEQGLVPLTRVLNMRMRVCMRVFMRMVCSVEPS